MPITKAFTEKNLKNIFSGWKLYAFTAVAIVLWYLMRSFIPEMYAIGVGVICGFVAIAMFHSVDNIFLGRVSTYDEIIVKQNAVYLGYLAILAACLIAGFICAFLVFIKL